MAAAGTPDRPRFAARRCLFGIVCLVGLSAQSYGPADLDAAFDRASIVISATSSACYRFNVWIASERQQQTRGLMFVRELAADAGMLFVYDGSGRRSMWMKNTFIPLDILFIREDGTIANIAIETEPLSLESIASSEPVRYVLELNAGVTDALGIVPGDIVMLHDSVAAASRRD